MPDRGYHTCTVWDCEGHWLYGDNCPGGDPKEVPSAHA